MNLVTSRTTRSLSAFAALLLSLLLVFVIATTARAADGGFGISPYEYTEEECDETLDDWYWDETQCEEPAPEDPPQEEDPDYQTSPGDTPPADWEQPAEPEPDPTKYWPAPPRGAVAKLRANGRTAVAPKSAPPPVKAMIKAANSLTRKPYKWGGGHGRWNDRGYDCSGAVSYVLRAGGLLSYPMVSGTLAKWGKKGKGRWIQIYANKGHVFMVVAGLRFDTSGFGERGPRWRTEPRGTRGFRLRHPAGL